MLRHRWWAAAATAVLLLGSGCDEDSVSPLARGDLEVALSMSGTLPAAQRRIREAQLRGQEYHPSSPDPA